MNKKIIIFLLVILLVGGGVYFFTKNKKENKKENPTSLSSEINTVNVGVNLSQQVIEYEKITVKDIDLNEEDKTLYFKISSKENISELKVSVVLLNAEVEDSANTKTMTLKNVSSEEKLIKMDLNEIYNTPGKIKFIFEK